MYEINVRSNVLQVERQLGALAQRQMPYAVAQALTALAKDGQQEVKISLPRTFKEPTPFTVNAVRIIPARKDNWESQVFVMDIAAAYLFPYEVGGLHKLIGKGVTWLEPADYDLLNRYGNFPRNTLARLKAQKACFVARLNTKKGPIDGVWMRVDKGSGNKSAKGRGVKLLIKFGDAHQAKQHLDFQKHVENAVNRNFNKRMGAALARAIATATRP